MKNILIILPSVAYGGQEKVALKTAQLLQKYYKVYVYIFYRRTKELDTEGINILSGNNCISSNPCLKIWNYLINYINIKKIKKELHIDVTISFATSANLLNIVSRHQDRVITTIRGVKSLYSTTSSLKFIQRKSDKLLCVSQELAQKAKEYYNMPDTKVDYLYNPYNLEEMDKKSNELIEDLSIFGEQTIITVGRLQPVKGYEHLIRAFSLVKKELPKCKLLIVGDGDLKNVFKHLIDRLQIQESVSIIGFQENPYKFLKHSSLFVLSSENEGFPNALVEAMAFIPVVSVDCKTGPREILTERMDNYVLDGFVLSEYGILCPPVVSTRNYTKTSIEKSEYYLYKAMKEILSNDKLYKRYQAAGRERVEAFSEKRYLEKVIQLIE